MSRGGFRHQREFTEEELDLIRNTSLSVTQLCSLVNASYPTIGNARKKLGITTVRGRRIGSSFIVPEKWETVKCANPLCDAEFTTLRCKNKKYCSHSCHVTVTNPARSGNPRKQRNPDMPAYKRYTRQVHRLSQQTYNENIDIINPERHVRTLAGVKDGWQLDHIVTIKECFEKGISVEKASELSNLRMLPWRDNLARNKKQ